MSGRLIILDRDGVINHDSDDYIKSPDEWLPIDGVGKAIALLNKAGYKVAVATNQSGLARGMFDEHVLQDIHHKMQDYLSGYGAHLDKVLFCSDHPNQPGPNRKPAPGMALELLALYSATASETWFVGDSLSDIQCANRASCKPALVKTGKGLRTLKEKSFASLNVPVYDDLLDFVTRELGLNV